MTQGINYIHYRVNIPGSEFNKILQDCGFSKLGMRNPSWNDHWITELHVWSDCVFMTFGFPHGLSFKLWVESQHRHCICGTSTQAPLHASLWTWVEHYSLFILTNRRWTAVLWQLPATPGQVQWQLWFHVFRYFQCLLMSSIFIAGCHRNWGQDDGWGVEYFRQRSSQPECSRDKHEWTQLTIS